MAGWTRALGHLLRDAARLDRTQSDPLVAARNAIAVVAPLLIAARFASPAAGLPATIGATSAVVVAVARRTSTR